jgi:hypothetical protein
LDSANVVVVKKPEYRQITGMATLKANPESFSMVMGLRVGRITQAGKEARRMRVMVDTRS